MAVTKCRSPSRARGFFIVVRCNPLRCAISLRHKPSLPRSSNCSCGSSGLTSRMFASTFDRIFQLYRLFLPRRFQRLRLREGGSVTHQKFCASLHCASPFVDVITGAYSAFAAFFRTMLTIVTCLACVTRKCACAGRAKSGSSSKENHRGKENSFHKSDYETVRHRNASTREELKNGSLRTPLDN